MTHSMQATFAIMIGDRILSTLIVLFFDHINMDCDSYVTSMITFLNNHFALSVFLHIDIASADDS